ncbi:ribose 5-phosphate isomerase B [Desulfarculus baarsii DSM 2075]|uniref:Ribose 5-phosphate isomerase B n=1 Tax=Desulfarculus baarsii (strain ATCC 33931 / DSM 2075 / LMG 7858 / VKM B-1802 / 2st14) TaxID=644282 RepID=E1QJK4_DESB2|nr:ribose 5-phosphate isomerase B [Desulfarculus baarsii]ADK85747.1 ribose 5-phosphate isomerase B [Desulfarculus baarsii DSM 2075]
MKIAIGCDHAGLTLKNEIARHLRALGHEIDDKGTHAAESTDYPDWAAQVARAVAAGQVQRGVLVCGSGIGMSISANRFKGVRAVLAPSVEYARLGRQHNDGNVLCLGERLTPLDEALAITDVFLNTDFEGGRHQRRVQKMDAFAGEEA